MFPDTLDGAQVLYHTPEDDFGQIMWDSGEPAFSIRYLAICRYPGSDSFYLFSCDHRFEVEGDSMWSSIEECMGVAEASHGGRIIWIEK